MARKALNLSVDEIRRAFSRASGTKIPEVLSPAQLSELIGISLKTLYEWVARGRLDGSYRRRGKHLFFWRDRALSEIFNGPDWPRS